MQPLRPQVLLIEDNPGDARLIKEMLREDPESRFDLIWTDRLAAGSAYLADARADVILLDLSLPDSHGLQTLSTIQQRTPGVPIVVLTGLADETLGLQAIHEGAQDYLVKGQVDSHMLTRALRYAVERARSEAVQRFLSAASSALAGSLDYATTIQVVANLMVPYLADCCVINVLDEHRGLTQVALSCVDPGQQDSMRQIYAGVPLDRDGPHPVAIALRNEQSMLYSVFPESLFADCATSPEHLERLQEFEFASAMFVPLLAQGRALGVVSLMTAESGRHYQMDDLGVAEDICRRAALAIDNAQLYRQAQEAIHLRDTVLSSVSHDLRNPLLAIRLIAETLADQASQIDSAPGQTIREGLERINANTTRMTAQISELLDVALLQMGREVELDRQPSNLIALVQEVISDYQMRTTRHQIRLESEHHHLLGDWDAPRIERVLGNLVSNAIKYTPAGGEVVIRVWREVGDDEVWAVFEVQDHGLGIPAVDLPRIFSWYHRGQNVSGHVAGAGVGLASSQRIVARHGGTISVVSEEDHGSTFTVRLPLTAPESV